LSVFCKKDRTATQRLILYIIGKVIGVLFLPQGSLLPFYPSTSFFGFSMTARSVWPLWLHEYGSRWQILFNIATL